MTDLTDKAAALVRLNGGQIVGKTRLQKMAYLLEAKGLGLGTEFDYRDFGPFSADLAFAMDDAEALGYVSTEERPGFHAVPYTIYAVNESCPSFDPADVRGVQAALKIMDGYSALVLELAATAVYLKSNGYPKDFWEEVKRRKPLKATPELIKMASKLISELKL